MAGQAGGDVDRVLGSSGGGVHDQEGSASGRRQSPGSQTHLPGDGGGGKRQQCQLTAVDGGGRGGGDLAARRPQRLGPLRVGITAPHPPSRRQQAARHPRSHDPQTDDGDGPVHPQNR